MFPRSFYMVCYVDKAFNFGKNFQKLVCKFLTSQMTWLVPRAQTQIETVLFVGVRQFPAIRIHGRIIEPTRAG